MAFSFCFAREGKLPVGGAIRPSLPGSLRPLLPLDTCSKASGLSEDKLPDRLLYRPSNPRAAARSLKNCFCHGNMKVDHCDHCKRAVPWHQMCSQ